MRLYFGSIFYVIEYDTAKKRKKAAVLMHRAIKDILYLGKKYYV
jgi:hypothetical protein